MAKITRKTQKVFASSAGGTGITEYGSPAGGTPAYSTDPDDIQTPAWETGWSAAALSGTEIPTFQDFNAIHNVSTRQIGYLLQEGIAEYDLGTEYHTNSIVKKTGTLELYGSLTDNNTGNALPSQTDDANWKYIGDLANGLGLPASETTAGIAELATTAEAQAGTDDERIVTPLKLHEAMLGSDSQQAWTNVTGSRSAGVTYTNTTGRPILVCITITTNTNEPYVVVDGVNVGRMGEDSSVSGGVFINTTVVVPNGSTYSIQNLSTVLDNWAELR